MIFPWFSISLLALFAITQHSWLVSPSIIAIISNLKDEAAENSYFSIFPCTGLVKNKNFLKSPQQNIMLCGDTWGSWKWDMLDTRRKCTFFWLVFHWTGKFYTEITIHKWVINIYKWYSRILLKSNTNWCTLAKMLIKANTTELLLLVKYSFLNGPVLFIKNFLFSHFSSWISGFYSLNKNRWPKKNIKSSGIILNVVAQWPSKFFQENILIKPFLHTSSWTQKITGLCQCNLCSCL